MQRLTLHLSGKKVNNISLSTSPYSRVNTMQFELDSIEHANGLTTYINHRFNLDFPIRNDNLFHCENVENFAWLVDILNSLGFLTTQDNIKIGEIINTVAVKIAQKKSLSPFSTPHQVIYLSQIAEFYIDEILKYANTWQDAVALLRLAFMGLRMDGGGQMLSKKSHSPL